jgi:hypothetical protein
LADGYLATRLLYVAVELGVAVSLADRPTTGLHDLEAKKA